MILAKQHQIKQFVERVDAENYHSGKEDDLVISTALTRKEKSLSLLGDCIDPLITQLSFYSLMYEGGNWFKGCSK